MTAVEDTTDTVIDRPRDEVAAFAMNPAHAPRWYAGIDEVEWTGGELPRRGARVAFVAHFLGRRLVYAFEVIEALVGERLVLRGVDTPFALETCYTFEALDATHTRVVQQHRARPAAFARLSARVLLYAIHRAGARDLGQLKALLESRPRR